MFVCVVVYHENDVFFCIQWCVCMWFLSSKAEAHMGSHVRYGMPASRMGTKAVLYLSSHATARQCQWSFSKLVLAFPTRSCQLNLSQTKDSNCLG